MNANSTTSEAAVATTARAHDDWKDLRFGFGLPSSYLAHRFRVVNALSRHGG